MFPIAKTEPRTVTASNGEKFSYDALLPKPAEPPMVLKVEQVAYLLGVSRTEVYRLMRESGLPFVEFSGKRRVVRRQLEEWVNGVADSQQPNGGMAVHRGRLNGRRQGR